MSRGIGEFAIQEYIPEWLAVVIGVLTQLGDLWFLGAVLAVCYWTMPDNQNGIAIVAGVALTGLGLYRGFKELLRLPRPDEPPLDPDLLPWILREIWELTATAGGYGFPSGHATSSTIVYFGLAAVLTVGTRRKRFLTAGVLVGLVGFSRVALGVHYSVDIVVGVALGAALLYVALRLFQGLTARQGTFTFTFAVLAGSFYVFTSDAEFDAVLVLGAALGSFAGWQLIVLARALITVERPSQAFRPIAFRGGLAALALAPLIAALEWFPILGGGPYAAGGAVGLAATVVIIVPIARYSERVQRVVRGVRFWAGALYSGLRALARPGTWQYLLRALWDRWRQFRDQ